MLKVHFRFIFKKSLLHLVINTYHLIISERSVTISQIIASEILSELVNSMRFHKMSWILINIFTKTWTCVSAPLSAFFSPVNYPFLRLIWYRLQGYAVYNPWFSCSYNSPLHFSAESHKCFPRVDAIMNLKSFGVLFDNKLAIMRFYFFVLYC